MPFLPAHPRRLPVLCASVGLAALLTACATTSPAGKAGLRPRQSADVGEPAAKIDASARGRADTNLYGLFLAGEAALDRGSSEDAARLLGRASELDTDPYLKERAFTAAVIAGDIGRAAAVPLVEGQGSVASSRLARLVRGVEALSTNHGAQALALFKDPPPQGQTAQAVILLTPWAAAAAGDWTVALGATPTSNSGAPQLTSLFASFGRARLLERANKLPEAETTFKTLTANPANVAFVLGYGGFLERRGRRAEAVALYDRTLAKTADAELSQARDRAAAGRPAPPMLTIQEGAGEALLPAAATLVARQQPELGLALMRLALHLDPKLDDAWLAVGDAMASAGDADSARQAYNQVVPASPKYTDAQARLAWNLQRAGSGDAALKLAKESLDRTHNSPDALSLYADLLRENGRFEEAIGVMDRLIAAAPNGDQEAWRLYYLRGVSWERSGHWDKAEPDLQQALKLNPAEPEIMNYLGFGWANRRQHLDEALGLLQKAAALRPTSGEIRDSLGWAEFRLDRFPDAVRDLERAVQLAPAEPDINDHLGDAYWRVGRRLEAQFQWRRVLTLQPDDELRNEAEGKLRTGLDAAAPPPGPVAAAGSSAARP